MSIETVPSNANAFDNFEESVSERRIRLHLELAINIQDLHKLETDHARRTMGLITLKHLIDTLDLNCHKQAQEDETTDLQLLAQSITRLRQQQGRLITETSHCNTTIWRPPHDDGRFDHRSNKQARADFEKPYVEEIYRSQDHHIGPHEQ